MKYILCATHFSARGRLTSLVTAESDVARDLLMPTDADKDRDCLTSCRGSTRMSLGYRLCSTNRLLFLLAAGNINIVERTRRTS